MALLGVILVDSRASGRFPSFIDGFPRDFLAAGLYGLLVAATGNPWLAAGGTILLVALLTVSSILKKRVLGESLIFSDVAVASSFLRYPRFYLDAVPRPLAITLLMLPLALGVLLFETVHFSPFQRMAGLCFVLISGGTFYILWNTRWRRTFMLRPDLPADLPRFGLLATLVIYGLRWHGEHNPLPCSPFPADDAPNVDLVIIVQCESFADPQTLVLGTALPPLSTLSRLTAETQDTVSGNLEVSGFGAYTMRTEYAVLFGRTEQELGFRSYDPFLSARGELSLALPNRLSRLFGKRVFLHPHDMRFYDRQTLMPQMGFNRVISTETFTASDYHGPYVSDAAIGRELTTMIHDPSPERRLIYTVTMENHGPWHKGRANSDSPLDAYLAHLRHGDALLDKLDQELTACGKKAVLVFFGDHRPSIPGVNMPVAARQTPYLLRRYGQPRSRSSIHRDLSPAALHHLLLEELGLETGNCRGR
ncbi:hypothetical protein GMO_01830 [Gluconobacter morbifer G707]|uniref:Sulfatase N-terminal domain-containing protein n=1 Tax=Gluconobacter morbifer G707 TaxID=1088869 RepID=G6XFB8_9PROT|nr:hypothetical protein GMO_01830 [Gluconobacter morbifer G707]